jgi:L-alanine-DL-glutamate epimerase-like enolase superfamily enzyme
MPVSVNERVHKRRETLRASGLRPVQIWVPDVRAKGFAEECRRQARLVAAGDAEDHDLAGLMEAALLDLGEP